jgi:hypothetical protein
LQRRGNDFGGRNPFHDGCPPAEVVDQLRKVTRAISRCVTASLPHLAAGTGEITNRGLLRENMEAQSGLPDAAKPRRIRLGAGTGIRPMLFVEAFSDKKT